MRRCEACRTTHSLEPSYISQGVVAKVQLGAAKVSCHALNIQPRVAQAQGWRRQGIQASAPALEVGMTRPQADSRQILCRLTHPRHTIQGPGRRLRAEKGGHAAGKGAEAASQPCDAFSSRNEANVVSHWSLARAGQA